MIVTFSNVIHSIVKAAVFTITYSLKVKFDFKQFQKTTMKTWKLVSPRPCIGTIRSRHACDYFDLFITIIGIERGGFDKKLQLPLWSGFRTFVLPRGLPPRGLKSKKKFDNFEKKRDFCWQMSSSSFHMFIYARSEQCDLGPIYTITNTQRIRIYSGKLKSILVKISPDLGR